MMEHLDVSSFKLVRVAAVDDDDLLHQGAEVAGERRLHLGGGDIHWLLVFTLQRHPADRQRRAYGEGGGAYHVPGDVLDVLEFATNRGQDQELKDD